MANEFITQLTPRDFFRESTLGDASYLCSAQSGPSGTANDLYGLTLPKLATQGYNALVPISHANTFTTGLTLTFYLVDDGTDSADLGKVVRLGVTFKRMIDGESADIDTAAATEQTTDITLQSTSGLVKVATLAVANANLDSLATGEACLLRVRRVSTATQDTCNGRVLLLGVSIKNT